MNTGNREERTKAISRSGLIAFFALCAATGCSKTAEGPNSTRWVDFDVEVSGGSVTKDNPWGYTAGVIKDDQFGNCMFLTPDTSFTIKNLPSDTELALQVRVHPLMREVSDGAGIDLRILDSDGNVLAEENKELSNAGNWKNIRCNLSEYPGAVAVVASCNGGSDNYNGDWVIFRKPEGYLSDFGQDDYVRSATYFGEVWPMNFWNSELETLDEDFAQIAADGFNSIIIVIPWREFQPGISPITYNDYPFENLDKVMNAANDHGLDVYARVGYVWDFYNDSNEYVVGRFRNLLSSEETRSAWLDYCGKLYDTLSEYPNFRDAFLTWEDMWAFLDLCAPEDETVRLESAKAAGYQEWVSSVYELDQYNNLFHCSYATYEEIPIPRRDEPAMEAYFDFYDYSQNKLLAETQKVFPNMSLEVRLDADGISLEDGNVVICNHEETYKCEDSDYTATMYGIPMGFDNHGQKVSAAEAMKNTDYILRNLSEKNGGKPIYVEQFLYMDNTQAFSYNAQVKDEEVGKYLEEVSGILNEYTRGYAIWTYRDYRTNMLYNPQFALGGEQWNCEGTPVIEKSAVHNTWSCKMAEGDAISQIIPAVRNHYAQDEYKLFFDVLEGKDAKLEISMGNAVNTVEISGSGRYETSFPKNDFFDLTIRVVEGETEIDNLCLYTFIQDGKLYDADNGEMELIGNLRVLNEQLSE